jgi:hypothetical protein
MLWSKAERKFMMQKVVVSFGPELEEFRVIFFNHQNFPYP